MSGFAEEMSKGGIRIEPCVQSTTSEEVTLDMVREMRETLAGSLALNDDNQDR